MQKKTQTKSVLTFLFFVLIGVAFFVMWGKQLPYDHKTKKDAEEMVDKKKGPVYSLEPLVVELKGRYLKVARMEEGKPPQIGTRKRYLSIAVDLELKDEKAMEEVEKRLAQIKDAISETTASKKVKDIENVDGKTALSNEILAKLNRLLQEDIVSNVFFAEFMIQ